MATDHKTESQDYSQSHTDFKPKYKTLKRKLKGLVYEHELLSEQLEKAQKKLLRVSRDRSFLLDRMLQYEKVADSSSDSDATDASDSEAEKVTKKKQSTSAISSQPHAAAEESQDSTVKKTPKQKPSKKNKSVKKTPPMTIEDIERHLDSRPSLPSIEKATSSMPADIFSNVDSDGTSDNEADTSLVIDTK